ncbi:hypothetical protein [Streptomyces turgidiscabies]|uniref:hypothetical protein n=1 Tax=Streptomyces turgidiscabies TaxID=85558 RepID=UPI004038A3B8
MALARCLQLLAVLLRRALPLEAGRGAARGTRDAVHERALATINIEYAAKRTSGRLGPLEFHTVGHDTIAAYTESRRQRGNTTQYKYSPFQKDTDFVADLVGGAGVSR